MKIFKNKIKDIVEKYEIKPKKRLGQNFIFDKNILYKISSNLEPFENYMIVEIGPGPGGLTSIILEKNPKRILLIEKDIAFKKILLDLKSEFPKTNTQIIFEDFLKLDLQKLEFFKKSKVKFISNLPYYISTQVLLKILPFEKNIFEAIFMFQKEVAERLLAKPNNKDYSKLSELEDLILDFRHKSIKDIFAFDYFVNDKIKEIKIGFRFVFQSKNKTLTDNEIDIVMNKIIESSQKIDGVLIPGLGS